MIPALCDDLLAERADLLAVLDGIDDWRVPTPAPGWSVLDQATHLAWSDETCALSIRDPGAFAGIREEAVGDIDGFVDKAAVAHRHLEPPFVRSWMMQAGARLDDVARSADPALRVPWFGPDMTLASALTARIMETWAHGQDVVDAAGIDRPPSPRLRHVAFLGWRAFANSFRARRLPVPDEAVRVELDDGAVVFGPEEATNVVRGTALDFCLVVTRRRHRDDTALAAEGPVADAWLDIAQAFAGPPGPGREPRHG